MGFEDKYKRRNPVVTEAPADATAMDTLKSLAEVAEEYDPFRFQSDPQFDLWLQTSDANEDPETSLPYGRRNKMTTDGAGFLITMHYDGPVLSVRLHGRGLKELHYKLLRHEVEWVREFDPRKWQAPAEGKPCVTAIEIRHRPLPERNTDAVPGEKKSDPDKATTH
jgi:hypothetical protein